MGGFYSGDTIAKATASNGKKPANTNLSGTTQAGNISIPSMKIDQPYDENTPEGKLANKAMEQHYTANGLYESLTNQVPYLMNQSTKVLGSVTSLLGKGFDAVNQSKTAGDKYFSQADDMFANSARYLQTGEGYLNKAGTEGDWWYDQAKNAYAQAQGFLPQIQDQFNYTTESNKWYDDYTRDALTGSKNLLDTGEIPKPLMDAMIAAMTNGVNQTVGTNVNDLASRGVLNSSVTNRALSGIENEVANAMNSNYLSAFNTILGGYNDTAVTSANAGKAFADSNMNIISGMNDTMTNAIGLGDSYGNTGHLRVSDLLGVAQGYGNYSSIANQNANSLTGAGSQRISDWLDIAQVYNDSAAGYGNLSQSYLNSLSQNRSERESLLNSVPQYWQNAVAPATFGSDLMQQMIAEWLGHTKDTAIY